MRRSLRGDMPAPYALGLDRGFFRLARSERASESARVERKYGVATRCVRFFGAQRGQRRRCNSKSSRSNAAISQRPHFLWHYRQESMTPRSAASVDTARLFKRCRPSDDRVTLSGTPAATRATRPRELIEQRSLMLTCVSRSTTDERMVASSVRGIARRGSSSDARAMRVTSG